MKFDTLLGDLCLRGVTPLAGVGIEIGSPPMALSTVTGSPPSRGWELKFVPGEGVAPLVASPPSRGWELKSAPPAAWRRTRGHPPRGGGN